MKTIMMFIVCAVSANSVRAQDTTGPAAQNQRLLEAAPAALQALSLEEFCSAYGYALRTQHMPNWYSGDEAPRLVRDEARRRKLRLNDKDVVQQRIRIGMNRCQLLAVWGDPTEQNRTVGSWGVNIQHVYPNAYVYTRNGVVTSWQD
jgi:hypothetical protein